MRTRRRTRNVAVRQTPTETDKDCGVTAA
jgi:hypothetical protein